MNGKLHIIVLLLFFIVSTTIGVKADDRWNSTFDTTQVITVNMDEAMTIDQIIDLVAGHNPLLRSIVFKREASVSQLQQAGVWQNPELSTEFEEVSWDAPGLSESEISISLSQEFEIFGQRNARINVALAQIESTNFETRLEAFDLYLKVKKRFFQLFYAQNKAILADSSVLLAEHITNSIEFRMKNGTALQSEFLLAQLELQRIQQDRNKIQQELISSKVELAVLWNGDFKNLLVTSSEEPDLMSAINKLPTLNQQVDSTRFVEKLYRENEILNSEKQLLSKEAKPAITLSGGFIKLKVNNSNSFLFGFSMPLPFFNRNQGAIASLDASIRANEYEQENIRIETRGFINSSIVKLNQLIDQHMTLDTLLLPTAENAYNTIKEAYSVGRIPYTSLLEVERSLIELRFEHNNILLAIHDQLIAIEQISGIRMYE